MYLMAQSCLHVVINFPRPVTEFRRNRQILSLGSKYSVLRKTVVPRYMHSYNRSRISQL